MPGRWWELAEGEECWDCRKGEVSGGLLTHVTGKLPQVGRGCAGGVGLVWDWRGSPGFGSEDRAHGQGQGASRCWSRPEHRWDHFAHPLGRSLGICGQV